MEVRQMVKAARRFSTLAALATVIGLLLVPGATTAAATATAAASVPGLHKIVDGLHQPDFLTTTGVAGDARLFVVERPGRIRILSRAGGTWHVTGTFLDLRARVGSSFEEQGLLGLAFAPDYATSGRFYVDYTNTSGNTVIAEYRRATADRADPGSRRKVLSVKQPFDNHNGGWLGFKGPDLYIALGDGGSGGDPGNRAQRLDTLLGKILRIDPRDPDGAGPRRFSIPADNPFVGEAGLDAIWAYGLRNPWRDAFDPPTGDLWIGDVGEEKYEEVDHAGTARGRNFGWHLLEGRHLYPSGDLCTSDCKTLPVVEYPHSVSGADNCTVIGGYVSRRSGGPLSGR
jgi:glucose/arabinose dehydrogenase